MLSLRSPFPRVRRDNQIAYGGNQMWSDRPTIRKVGCGAVAGLDLLRYLSGETGREPLPLMDYNRQLSDLCRHYFPLIPGHGINGVTLAIGLNRLFHRHGLPYRAAWAFSGSKLWERVREMLERDVPVILSIGPNFPLVWRKERLPFYSRRANGSFVRTSSAKSHYVTVTGMDDSWVRISSWGREFYINRHEYDAFVKQHSTSLFSNIMYVKRTDS